MSDEDERQITVARDGGVVRIALDRPDQMNALSSPLLRQLEAEVVRAAADPGDRVVVVTGTGPAFCAGADLKEAREVAADVHAFRSWLTGWRRTFRAIETCSCPVIAALNGTTLAGGLELALACDLIVASRAARIGDGHIRYGLVPGGGGSKRLPDAVGSRAARWLMYTGSLLDADTAAGLGLVQQVLPAETFDRDVAALAGTLAGRSAPALAFMKRMSRPHVSEDDLDMEIEAAALVVTGPDGQEGLAAFTEKREPRFA